MAVVGIVVVVAKDALIGDVGAAVPALGAHAAKIKPLTTNMLPSLKLNVVVIVMLVVCRS